MNFNIQTSLIRVCEMAEITERKSMSLCHSAHLKSQHEHNISSF